MLLQGVQILLSISSSPCSKQLGKDAHNDFHLQTMQQACTLQKAQSSALYRVAAALTALHNRRCCAAAACPAMGVDTDNCRADVLHLFYLTLNFGCIFKALYRIFGSRRNTKTQPLIPNNQQAARSCFPFQSQKKTSVGTASAAPPLCPFCRAEKTTRQNVFVSDHPERSE
jgi:hypothetical protein